MITPAQYRTLVKEYQNTVILPELLDWLTPRPGVSNRWRLLAFCSHANLFLFSPFPALETKNPS
jgi:hypothetical protein